MWLWHSYQPLSQGDGIELAITYLELGDWVAGMPLSIVWAKQFEYRGFGVFGVVVSKPHQVDL